MSADDQELEALQKRIKEREAREAQAKKEEAEWELERQRREEERKKKKEARTTKAPEGQCLGGMFESSYNRHSSLTSSHAPHLHCRHQKTRH
jgi:hypothetical protein